MENKKASEVNPLEFKSVSELYSMPAEIISFCVEDLLPSGGLSILAGKPKAGKSTLARQLAVAVAQGKPFLGRKTEKGKVLYLALEEKLSEVINHFSDLGLTEQDDVLTRCEPAPQHPIPVLERTLDLYPDVRLAIIDPLFKFIHIPDGNDYAVVNNAIEPLLTLARKRSVHIIVVHHRKKRRAEDSMDDMLGSTALSGGVDTILMLDVQQATRTLQSRQRYGVDLAETQLKWDPDKRNLSLGVSSDEAALLDSRKTEERIESDFYQYLCLHPDSTQAAIFDAVTGKTITKKKFFREMLDAGHIKETGAGKKGEPFTYSNVTVEVESSPVEQPNYSRPEAIAV